MLAEESAVGGEPSDFTQSRPLQGVTGPHVLRTPVLLSDALLAHDVERLRENLADFNEKLFKKLYQNRLDGRITCHVLVQIFLNS